jgi:hypothetical protein
MKLRVLFAISFILFGTNQVYCQYQFTLDDLQKLCYMNSNDFDTYVVLKGYRFTNTGSNENNKVYVSEIKNSSTENNSTSWTKMPNEPIIVGYGTTDKEYYLNLKTNILTKENGWFFLTEQNINKDLTFYHYTNFKYHITLYSFSVGEGTSNAFTQYNIQYFVEKPLEPQSTPKSKNIPETGIIQDTDGSTNLRSLPTASSKLIQKVYNGNKFTIISREGDWLKIKIDKNGAIGFIHKTRAKL